MQPEMFFSRSTYSTKKREQLLLHFRGAAAATVSYVGSCMQWISRKRTTLLATEEDLQPDFSEDDTSES